MIVILAVSGIALVVGIIVGVFAAHQWIAVAVERATYTWLDSNGRAILGAWLYDKEDRAFEAGRLATKEYDGAPHEAGSDAPG